MKKPRCHFQVSEVLKASRPHEEFKIQYYYHKALPLYGLDTFQTETPTEQMSLSLAQSTERSVNHRSDKHLPVLSHSPSFAKVRWTVKPSKGLNSAKASTSLMTAPSHSQKKKGRLQEKCEGKDNISPAQLQTIIF